MKNFAWRGITRRGRGLKTERGRLLDGALSRFQHIGANRRETFNICLYLIVTVQQGRLFLLDMNQPVLKSPSVQKMRTCYTQYHYLIASGIYDFMNLKSCELIPSIDWKVTARSVHSGTE